MEVEELELGPLSLSNPGKWQEEISLARWLSEKVKVKDCPTAT